MYNIIRLLRSKDWSVRVMTLVNGNFSREYLCRGFRVRWFDESISAEECRELSVKYELVICNTVFCAKVACRLQEYVKTILLIREAENLPEILEKCHINEWYIRSAENVVCVSEYAEHLLQKRIRCGGCGCYITSR